MKMDWKKLYRVSSFLFWRLIVLGLIVFAVTGDIPDGLSAGVWVALVIGIIASWMDLGDKMIIVDVTIGYLFSEVEWVMLKVLHSARHYHMFTKRLIEAVRADEKTVLKSINLLSLDDLVVRRKGGVQLTAMGRKIVEKGKVQKD